MKQEIIDKIEKVKVEKRDILELNDLGLTEIPREIFEIENLKILRLKKNKISSIPSDIKKLKNLIELNVIDNQIESLPNELFQLKELEGLQLRKNNLKILPGALGKLKKLKTLNVGDNQIEIIEEGVGNLESLTTLYLKKNKIKRLPKSFGKLINLKGLLLDENPIEYPDPKIIKAGLMRIMIFFLVEEASSKSTNGFSFKVPKEMKTAVKQYLVYFQEYVEIAKGRKIVFEVRSTDDGIFVETSQNDDLNELNVFFNEYLGFVKSNIDDLQPNIENPISETKKELFVLELKQQVHHLKQQLEIKNFQLKHLEKQVDDYFNLLTLQNSRPLPIYINALSNSNSVSESKAELNSTIEMNLKVELPKLQLEMLDLKNSLTSDVPDSMIEEIKIIDSELLDVEVEDIESVDKRPLTRIKRIFDQLTEDDSAFGKAVKKSTKLKESLQKLGKTYNKIAQWMALPVIPDVLLDL